MKFIVDRKTWYRGKGGKNSKLLLEDGTRCCIGFVGQHCGMPDEYLLGQGGVYDVPDDRWPKWMKNYNGPITEAYSVNDDATISDAERESKLQEIFRANGDEIEFVN
jgi:hypothetical protein